MKDIFVRIKVKPSAKKNDVILAGIILRVSVTAPAHGGKANEAVVSLLAEHFDVKKSSITIVKGKKTSDKLIRIME